MADKLLVPRFGITAAGSIVSQPFGIAGMTGWSVELFLTGTAFTGTFKIELSNSNSNWFDVTSQMISPVTGAIVQPGAGGALTGDYGALLGASTTVPPAELARVTLTWGSGAASAYAGWGLGGPPMTDFAAGNVFNLGPSASGSISRIAFSSLSASSGTNITIPSTARKLYVAIRGTGGMTAGFATAVLARFNADSGNNYRWIYPSLATDAVAPTITSASDQTTPQQSSMLLAITSSAPATDINIAAEFDIAVVSGTSRAFRSWLTTVGAAAASSYVNYTAGWWTNTASTVTQLNLLFGSAFSGVVTVDAEF